MSASPHSFPELPRGPDLLGELLHSLSQPLTGLRCCLELSLEEVAEQRQESVAMALQQTEKVVAMIQLMREYLDAGQPGPSRFSTALLPALRNLIEDLASIAAVRDVEVHVRFAGSCRATVPVPEARLRLALQYLIMAVIDAQPAGGGVTLALMESPAGTVLRTERDSAARLPPRETLASTSASAAASTLRRAKRAIASRVFESAGASLVFEDESGDAGFVLRLPIRAAARPACQEDGAAPVSATDAS
jgi:hypothetical protein